MLEYEIDLLVSDMIDLRLLSTSYRDFKLDGSEWYKDEYPPVYGRPRPIIEQILVLASVLDLDPRKALRFANKLPKLPFLAEGWFAIPSVKALVRKHFPKMIDNPRKEYRLAIELLLNVFKNPRSKLFVKDCLRSYFRESSNQLPSSSKKVHPRVTYRTEDAIDRIERKQKSEILIIPAQLGYFRQHENVAKVYSCLMNNEFGLGVVSALAILITNPERFSCPCQLRMHCPGDEIIFEQERYSSYGHCWIPMFRSTGRWGRSELSYDSVDSISNVALATGFVIKDTEPLEKLSGWEGAKFSSVTVPYIQPTWEEWKERIKTHRQLRKKKFNVNK
ncbi:MAG TPA: hypothetical protein DCE80_04600 [Ignavibacteriales bacterium]|nr:hypothetical protein [Ignavibacteriales bacterium]